VASPGTIIHTAVSGTSDMDEIYLYACNIDTEAILLTIEKGDTSASDQLVMNIPAQSGVFLNLPGTPLNNSLVVRGFAVAGKADKINVDGFVNRITA
jgi:hypothetical protein